MENNYVDNPFESQAIISFCTGIRGLDRGIERAFGSLQWPKPTTAVYVENEMFCCANLVAGMEAGVLDPAPIWTDAKTFNALPFRGRIHGIIGGYPCPGESLAGLREGHLYKGFIWPAIRRAIAAARPLWCFFENVDDHLTGTYPIVQRSLRNMGYSVEAGIYEAEEVGASHERKRLFILALAYPNRTSAVREFRNLLYKGGKNERTSQGENGQRSWNEFEYGCKSVVGEKEMANTLCITGQEIQVEAWHTGFGQKPIRNGKTWGIERFPMPQGYDQWEWEESRVLESKMGIAIDGYNFREDLLRAIGNSVVEQTAELAFMDLMKKHLKSIAI